MAKWKGVCIHHSLSRDTVARDWDGIRKYHMSYRHNGEIITEARFLELKAKGARGLEAPWRANGYHYGVESVNGIPSVMIGRPETMSGAHCPPLNSTHLGICVVGNFDLVNPAEGTIAELVRLIRMLAQRHGFPLGSIEYHNQYAPKTCPGKLFLPKAELIERVTG